MTQDPIGLAGGVNLYAYAGSNPLAFSDPFGLFDVTYRDAKTKVFVDAMREASPTFNKAMAALEADNGVLVNIGEGSTLPCGGSGGCTQFLGSTEGQQVFDVTYDLNGVTSDNAVAGLSGSTSDVFTVIAHEVYGHVVPGVDDQGKEMSKPERPVY